VCNSDPLIKHYFWTFSSYKITAKARFKFYDLIKKLKNNTTFKQINIAPKLDVPMLDYRINLALIRLKIRTEPTVEELKVALHGVSQQQPYT